MENIYKPKTLDSAKAILIAHSNEKGGVGKTNQSFNMAYRLAEKGHRVLVVDFDGQRNMSKILLGNISTVEQIGKYGFTSDRLFNPDLDQSEITAYKSVCHTNIHCIPAQKERIAVVLATAQGPKVISSPSNALNSLDYDYILIDTPPSLGVTQVAAIYAVHSIFIPIEIDDFSNEGLISLYKTIANVRKKMKGTADLSGIYINKYKKPSERKDGNPYKEMLNTLKMQYKDLLIDTYIPDAISIKEARMNGLAPWVKPPNGSAAVKGRANRDAIDKMIEKLPAKLNETESNHD